MRFYTIGNHKSPLMTIHPLRLKPGQDLKVALEEFARQERIHAGWLLSGIGSLTQSNIRFANAQEGTIRKGYSEIISLSGTISINGIHVHISIADQQGRVEGGHLLDGNVIYSTAEIIIAESKDHIFSREYDAQSGFKELRVSSNKNPGTPDF